MKYIHLNCDLGEGGENDASLMPFISACNIACGGHAGDPESMQRTVRLSRKYNVQMGAHPSYEDRKNFGRLSLPMDPARLQKSLVSQITDLKKIVEKSGGHLSHVKPHGALYNDAVIDETVAEVIIKAVMEVDREFPVFAPQFSAVSRLAQGKIKVIFEAFADRNYTQNYELVSRSSPGALILEKEAVYEHLISMFLEKEITCENGKKIPCEALTFCLHSDTPNAVEILQFLSDKLKENSIQIMKK